MSGRDREEKSGGVNGPPTHVTDLQFIFVVVAVLLYLIFFLKIFNNNVL